ncbi:hypothetical protein TSOC_014627, partial [Tetrabaena socialis]
LIDPAKGKQAAYSDAAAATSHLAGATFRATPASSSSAPEVPHSDLPRRHHHYVQQPQPDTVPTLLRAEGGGGDDRGPLGRRAYPELPAPNKFDGRRDMYGHMTYKPLTDTEQTKYGKAFDDSGRQGGRRSLPVPGSSDPAKGADLLQWRPEVRLGQFVPRGGLAQEGRARGATLRAISGRSLVVLAEGFEWVNEGTAVKPKPGYVATRPGARLQLRLDTDRSAVGSAADEKVHVYVHHLRSYQHMGSAKLSCASGCSCAEVVVDAHITEQASQVYMAELVASQSKECVVEVLPKSSSGEHKF